MSDSAEELPEPANDGTPDPEPLAAWRLKLAAFLQRNPYSDVDQRGAQEKVRVRIVQPWGDASLAINLVQNTDAMVDALNNILLPERFIAIWHSDTKRLEVIWTAFELSGPSKEIVGRSFSFRFKGITYLCSFTDSSDRLITIARGFQPIGETASRYRNLPSFYFYALEKSGDLPRFPPVAVDRPFSFWIDGIQDWDEAMILDLANHLNFYLGYYDTVSPAIEIQSPKLEALTAQPQTRYIAGSFPSLITGRPIDDNILRYWEASRRGDTAHRFLYSYRVVEYCSFSYLDETTRATIRRALSAPNALDELTNVTEKITLAVLEAKINDVQKFDGLIEHAVKPATLWREIERNIGAFVTDTVFDGGYVVKPIAKVGWKAEDFGVNGVGQFSRAARGIRNALSHGRDMQSTSVIAPTPHNFQRLQPWAAVMAAAAGDVVLYRDTT